MIDRGHFFQSVSQHLSHLSQNQVDGFNFLLDGWEANFSTVDIRHFAYCLATAWHETATKMEPIEEYGHGHGRPYGPSGFFGRGYVQLTWKQNYALASTRLNGELGMNVDLVADKEKALDPEVAAPIMFLGMREGWFTGKKLANYFHDGVEDPFNARRIINGTDKATLIAGYYHAFKVALT
jgi:putative chitinase